MSLIFSIFLLNLKIKDYSIILYLYQIKLKQVNEIMNILNYNRTRTYFSWFHDAHSFHFAAQQGYYAHTGPFSFPLLLSFTLVYRSLFLSLALEYWTPLVASARAAVTAIVRPFFEISGTFSGSVSFFSFSPGLFNATILPSPW